ncbi:MAG: mycofactocin biosynthesis FMN-dependent deaminase MftD [Bifidobacteriaceae bacterium]|jgi:heme/flavin dehydrogenase (mycofactocin system)|nr:mycofactocin biosynthesis FMN-dependent deaminase MftD [Bifidobacteriaceae bacterium]
MSRSWFETVDEARRRAERRLPRSVYLALRAGSERGGTLRDNTRAFGELGFAPHVVDLATGPDLSATVMGLKIDLPVIISPTGAQAVHPAGEVAVAKAAANRGTAMGLAGFASKPVEDVVAANPATLFQTYWCGDREAMRLRIERARNAGVVGLIVTLDWSFANGRDWGSPRIPTRLDLKTLASFAPEVLLGRKFRYLWDIARSGHLPVLGVPNMALPGLKAPGFFEAYGEWMATPQPTWEDIRWLRELWSGPFLVKGITRVDDARQAVAAGASAISVSNHGGNNLDGTPASVRFLPSVVDAVGDQVEVLMDGGIRRGSDVVKALALGAKAVLIGRASLWGLAANGQAGVENVLDILRGGMESTLMALRKPRIGDLRRSDLLIPEGFIRSVGAAK